MYQSWSWVTFSKPNPKLLDPSSSVGVRLKVGGINIEKIEGVGSGEGLCPPSWWSGGLLQKKINFALEIMQFWVSFGTSFLYYSRKWGPQSWKWGTYPPVPPLRRLWTQPNQQKSSPDPTQPIIDTWYGILGYR